MSAAPTGEWRGFCDDFNAVAQQIDRVRAVNVNARGLRDSAQRVAERYLHTTRRTLVDAGVQEEAAVLDDALGRLLELSHAPQALSSYKTQTRKVRKLIPGITKKLALSVGASGSRKQATEDETKLIGTLEGLAPSAALSYRQALADLNDEKRISFRGPALELREALREVLDALAPDDDVMAADGFKLEQDRSRPTTKQKVRFILRARGLNKANREAPEDAASSVEDLMGELTRSVQNLSLHTPLAILRSRSGSETGSECGSEASDAV